jgi:glycosyltransferase involved in cell wall biosynthesis
MRILVLSNLYPPYHAGGYGVLCHHLCEGLQSRGHEVHVLTTVAPGGAVHPGGHRTTVTVRRALRFSHECGAVALIWRTLQNHRHVRRAIAEIRPDLIYAFSVDGVGYQVHHDASVSGVPLVTVAGDTWLGQAWRDLPQFDPWIALANAHHTRGPQAWVKRCLGALGRCAGLYTGTRPVAAHPVHAISSFLLEDLRASGMPLDERSVLIRCPLDAAFLDAGGCPVGRPAGREPTLRALFISRMELLKGPDAAIRALALAVATGVDVTLTLAGIGAEAMQPTLNRLAADVGVGGRIRWAQAGDAGALVDLYRTHDVFLFPSRIVEGLGLVCLEAMACGLPVLGTDTGGQQDLILDDRTGFRFKPDDVEHLGSLLARLAQDRELLEKLSAGAVSRAADYEPSRVFDRVEASLLAVAAAGERRNGNAQRGKSRWP